MTSVVALRDATHLRLLRPADMSWVDDLAWVPVGSTELHLAARHFPLAVRHDGDGRRLGLLIGRSFHVRRLHQDGAWCGGYQPLALRCGPFTLGGGSNDPLADVCVDIASRWLSPNDGLPFIDVDGVPSPVARELHRMLSLLAASETAFAPAIDHLLIASLLRPLDHQRIVEGAASYLVLDPAAVRRLDGAALGAMARNNYLAVDIAIAGQFSLQALHPDLRPKTGQRERAIQEQDAVRVPISVPDVMLDELTLALDASELIPLTAFDSPSVAPGI